ncbi:MAG: glycosyltransferase family 39 protein, partial [Chloroflexota bacterium]
TTPGVLRAWSWLIGVLAVALVYRLAADMHSPTAGWLAATLLGTSAFFIIYMHEARAYLQLAALAALTVWAYWRLLSRDEVHRIFYLLLWGGVAGLLYTHYMAVMLLAALALYHVYAATTRQAWRWWPIVWTVALAGLAFVPWALRALEALDQVDGDSSRDFFALSPVELVVRTLERFGNGSALLVLVLAWLGLRDGRRLLTWLVAGTIAFALIANAIVGFLTDVHYMVAVFPALAVLAGVGAAGLPRGRWAVVTFWAGAGIWLTIFPPDPASDALRRYAPWDDVLATVEPVAGPFDTVAYLLPEPDPAWIHQPVADFYTASSEVSIKVIDAYPDKIPADYRKELSRLVEGNDRLWIAERTSSAHLASPRGTGVRNEMILNGDLLDCNLSYEVDDLRVRLYAQPAGSGWVMPMERGLGIGRHQWEPIITETGDYTFLLLTARDETVPEGVYSVSVQLSPANSDAIIFQQDFPLPEAPTACTAIQVPLTDVPKGDYQMFGVVYNWST